MAPEVVAQREVGAASDIWSCGCVILEMVTGRHPWADKNFKNVYQAGSTFLFFSHIITIQFFFRCRWRTKRVEILVFFSPCRLSFKCFKSNLKVTSPRMVPCRRFRNPCPTIFWICWRIAWNEILQNDQLRNSCQRNPCLTVSRFRWWLRLTIRIGKAWKRWCDSSFRCDQYMQSSSSCWYRFMNSKRTTKCKHLFKVVCRNQ